MQDTLHLWMKITGAAIVFIGVLLGIVLKMILDSLRGIKTDIKAVETRLGAIEVKMGQMQGENDVTKNVMISLVHREKP